MPDQLTLDTMIVRDHWEAREGAADFEELLRLRDAGEVDLAVTATIWEDVPREPLAQRLAELPVLGITQTPALARLGRWVLGEHMLGSGAFEDFRLRIESEREPEDLPGRKDWDHLHAHKARRRDVFLTRDRAILDLAQPLRDELGVLVMTASGYLEARRSR